MHDIHDWNGTYRLQAAIQGWCISEVGEYNGHSPFEIQRIDDAEGVSLDWGVTIPQLSGDDEAVAAMRRAYEAGEDHAILAHHIIRNTSVGEFRHWNMDQWRVRQPAAG